MRTLPRARARAYRCGMKYTITDEFATTPQRYWEVFFDEEYNRGLFAALKVGREVLELRREGEGEALEVWRKLRLTPQREVPAALQRFIKGAIAYVEDNHFRARTNAMSVVTTPSLLAESIITRGTYRLEVAGPRAVRRIWDGEVTVKIPLVGSKAEKILIDEVTASYKTTTDFTRRWLAEHP
jgi:hypothetical protein